LSDINMPEQTIRREYVITITRQEKPTPTDAVMNLPKTGDDSQSAVWIAMCLFSIAGMFAVSKQTRKRRME